MSNHQEVLTEADDVDLSDFEDATPTYKFPVLRHNFYWITVLYTYHKFASDTCALNQANFIVKRAPVEKQWFWLVENRLNVWEQAPASPQEKQALLQLAFEQCRLPVADRFWNQRAVDAGDPSVAESSVDATLSIAECVRNFGLEQDDFVDASGQTLAVIEASQPADQVTAEREAAMEAEQALLFAQSRENMGHGGASSGGYGDVDADGDTSMG